MGMVGKSVKTIIERIDSKEILLPSMQRKFVWSEEKIINLFDSIMKGYPFGSLVFWTLNIKEDINKYHFYEFIRDYSMRDDTINSKAGKIVKESIDIVLDGQQRLTSLYIGIKGSLETIGKGLRRNIAENWKKKHLYIVPHISADDRNEDETPYRFLFLEDEYVAAENEKKEAQEKYYLVSDLYGLTRNEFNQKYCVQRVRRDDENWLYVLEKLRRYVNEDEIINYTVIENRSITDVLEIFKRINNGGTPLSPSNLLFSTVITSWEQGREEMDAFITSTNKENVIVLKEDFLVRTCVYLMNKPASAKIEVLTKDVVDSIKDNWVAIKQAITKAKNLLRKNNITDEAILSYNALIPIIYFYFYLPKKVRKSDLEKSEKQLLYFFAVSQMFSLFGGSSATTLDLVRKGLCQNENLGELIIPFELKNLFDIDLSAGRINAFKITKEQVERLVDSVHYGDKKSYVMLCLLQPNIKLNGNYYDVDHVCSKDELKAMFATKRGDSRKILEEKKNSISNLQLLDYQQNRGDKNKDTLYTWVVEKGNKIPFDPYEKNKKKNKGKYKLKTIKDFEDFYDNRRKQIIEYLCSCFDI